MPHSMFDLPLPDSIHKQHSEKLIEHIRQSMTDNWINFERYMELALYSPGLGYYSAGLRKFGTEGDFVTAPELGTLFAQCVATEMASILEQLSGGDIIEIGGGSGRFAVDALLALERLDQLPDTWWMMERSGDLRQRQQQLIHTEVPHLSSIVQWLDEPPENLEKGVLFANEVLDALPVQVFQQNASGIHELGVSWKNGFEFQTRPATLEDAQAFEQCLKVGGVPPEQPYTSEVCRFLPKWLSGWSDVFQKGCWLFSDYGMLRSAYYHPQRDQGTLLCHYRHRAHSNPLILTGLQDITAQVDFDAVAEATLDCGWQIAGLTSQAQFLLNNGLTDHLAQSSNLSQQAYLAKTAEVKQLTLPGEMGEAFQFFAATRGMEFKLNAF